MYIRMCTVVAIPEVFTTILQVMQRTAGPYIRYSNGVKGIALLYPEGVSYPLEQKKLPVV